MLKKSFSDSHINNNEESKISDKYVQDFAQNLDIHTKFTKEEQKVDKRTSGRGAQPIANSACTVNSGKKLVEGRNAESHPPSSHHASIGDVSSFPFKKVIPRGMKIRFTSSKQGVIPPNLIEQKNERLSD